MEGDSYFDMDDLVYETGQSQKSYEETKELVNQTSSSVIVSRSPHTHYIWLIPTMYFRTGVRGGQGPRRVFSCFPRLRLLSPTSGIARLGQELMHIVTWISPLLTRGYGLLNPASDLALTQPPQWLQSGAPPLPASSEDFPCHKLSLTLPRLITSTVPSSTPRWAVGQRRWECCTFMYLRLLSDLDEQAQEKVKAQI